MVTIVGGSSVEWCFVLVEAVAVVVCVVVMLVVVDCMVVVVVKVS